MERGIRFSVEKPVAVLTVPRTVIHSRSFESLISKHKKRTPYRCPFFMAEREGFEPSERY